MQRVVRSTGRALLVTGVLLPGALMGGAAQAAGDGGNGLLRLAHLSPDTPAVDVYVDAVADPDAGIMLSGVAYGTISDYQDVPPGAYTVSMREAGAAADTPPVLTTTVEVDGDTARTVAGVGLFAALNLAIIEDSLDTPAEGEARVRVLAGASNAETVDVTLADGVELASGLEFASTGEYVDVPAGSTTVEVAAADGEPSELPIELDAGSVYSLVVLDGEGPGLDVQPVLDAASPGVVPVGGVETGAGGTADDGPALGTVALAVGAVGAALVLGTRHRGSARHAASRR